MKHLWPIAFSCGCLYLACAGGRDVRPPDVLPPVDPPQEELPLEPLNIFGERRAWQHFDALARKMPRPAGSHGAARARNYIQAELNKLGLEAAEISYALPGKEVGSGRLVTHLEVHLPNTQVESTGYILIGGQYDLPGEEGHWDCNYESHSGPAVLLELVRLLVAEPLAYPVRVILLSGELEPGLPNDIRFAASSAWVEDLVRSGAIHDLRFALMIGNVAGWQLRLERDLYSMPSFREFFEESAHELGLAERLLQKRYLTGVEASHLSLLKAGMPRVVALFGAQEQSDGRVCEPAALAAAGAIAYHGLRKSSQRLAKLERLAKAPFREEFRWEPWVKLPQVKVEEEDASQVDAVNSPDTPEG